VKEVCGGAREQSENDRPAEIAFQAVTEGLTPGEERANASQEKKRKPHRNHNLLKNGAPTLMRLLVNIRKRPEKRAGENGDAATEEEEVVKRGAGFAGESSNQLIFALQIVAILDVATKQTKSVNARKLTNHGRYANRNA